MTLAMAVIICLVVGLYAPLWLVITAAAAFAVMIWHERQREAG